MRNSSLKPWLTSLVVAVSPLIAQAAGPTPGAGSILQQVQPPTVPAPPSSEPVLTIQRQTSETAAEGMSFAVTTLIITGNEKIDTQTLHALVAESEGKTLTLVQLDALAARITQYYRDHGYPLTRAIIPAQEIRGGVVRIEVLEARYGKILLNNSGPVDENLLHKTLAPLQSDTIVEQAAMDRTLLLLSDIPGVGVNATLKPGDSVGTSDLLVNTLPTASVTGNATADDYGNRYTGRARLGAGVTLNNPLLQYGDTLYVSGLSSGRNLNFGRAAYESWINGEGTRLGGSWSALHYILGGPLASLEGHGNADVGSLWLRHPLVRSRNFNLYGQIQYDRMWLQDHLDVNAILTDRHLSNWIGSFSGDVQDTLLTGGFSTWNLSLTSGQVNFDNNAAGLADAASTKTQGEFTKGNLTLSRLQNLGTQNALYLTLYGQWANSNLDPSQQMVLGAPYSVRAYDMGALSADAGVQGSVELRHALGAALDGDWQAVAFVDSAHASINRNTWTTGVNDVAMSGAGLGFNWVGRNQWIAKMSVATPIGSRPVLVGTTASTHAWLEISRLF
ncbi:MAG: ShlB/FhaC/HecB family hemolysin secretion/activation protein [Betaproteobacteria bacterium]|nr:ShlB/FhaC/HecB family hemolysin secretion/activation protein [Betaproteobacteria bacterium]